jgi:hypothetical protein
MDALHCSPDGRRFELRFASLSETGQDFAFPCDAKGVVDLDALPERARVDYYFARSVVGRDVARPFIVAYASRAVSYSFHI